MYVLKASNSFQLSSITVFDTIKYDKEFKTEKKNQPRINTQTSLELYNKT